MPTYQSEVTINSTVHRNEFEAEDMMDAGMELLAVSDFDFDETVSSVNIKKI